MLKLCGRGKRAAGKRKNKIQILHRALAGEEVIETKTIPIPKKKNLKNSVLRA